MRQHLAAVSTGTLCTVTFQRPDPPVPHRGWARKAPRIQPNDCVTAVQEQFLDNFCKPYELRKSPLPRAQTVLDAMNVKFRPLDEDEDGRLKRMELTPIFNWLKRRWALKKAAALESLADGVGSDDASSDSDVGVGGGTGASGGGATAGAETDVDFSSLPYSQLVDECKARNLSIKGPRGGAKSKAEVLINRLKNHDDGK